MVKIGQFSVEDARAIASYVAEQLRTGRRDDQSRTRRPRVKPRVGGRRGQPAKVTIEVNARSGTTRGSGTVQPLKDDLSNDGSTLVVYSFVSAVIAVDAYVWIEESSNGDWWITAEDCG